MELWLAGSDCRRWPGSRMASLVERTQISCPIEFSRRGKGVRVGWMGGHGVGMLLRGGGGGACSLLIGQGSFIRFGGDVFFVV